MSTNQLILHPQNAFVGNSSLNLFVEQLKFEGFLGEQFDFYSDISYKQGSHFFDFIVFDSNHQIGVLERTGKGLKVSHVVDSRNNLRIHVRPVSSEPKVIISPIADQIKPACPNCHNYVPEGLDVITAWYENKVDYYWNCLHCRKRFQVFELNWSRSASFARYAIEIESIWPEEAYPNQKFLNLLQSITGESWTYMYYRM